MTFSEWTRRNKQNETAAKSAQTTAPVSSTPDTAQTTGTNVPTFAEWTAQRKKERTSGTAPVLYQQSGTERLSQEYLNRQSERANPAALPELTTPGTSYAEDRTLRQNNVLRHPVGQSADAETLTEMTKLKTLERAARDEGISNLRNHTHKSTANEALVGQQNKIARHGLEGGAQSAKNGQAVSKIGQNRRDNLFDNLRLLDRVTGGEEIDPGISAEKKKAAAQSGGNLATGQNY